MPAITPPRADATSVAVDSNPVCGVVSVNAVAIAASDSGSTQKSYESSPYPRKAPRKARRPAGLSSANQVTAGRVAAGEVVDGSAGGSVGLDGGAARPGRSLIWTPR